MAILEKHRYMLIGNALTNSPLSRFCCRMAKLLKQLGSRWADDTGLKPGVNEMARI